MPPPRPCGSRIGLGRLPGVRDDVDEATRSLDTVVSTLDGAKSQLDDLMDDKTTYEALTRNKVNAGVSVAAPRRRWIWIGGSDQDSGSGCRDYRFRSVEYNNMPSNVGQRNGDWRFRAKRAGVFSVHLHVQQYASYGYARIHANRQIMDTRTRRGNDATTRNNWGDINAHQLWPMNVNWDFRIQLCRDNGNVVYRRWRNDGSNYASRLVIEYLGAK